MTFFNKKEDVINIELTPYGRSLLSNGKLEAAYYAFFDNDILYDSTAGGFSEESNEILARITTETPYLKPQRDILSPEGLISSYERTQADTRPHTKLKLNYMTEPLGTSKGTSDYGPAWKSTFIQGKINGTVPTVLTGSNMYLRQIPQIESTIEYTMQIKNNADNPPVRGQLVSPAAPVSAIFPDGTYLDIIEKQILCQLLEKDGFLLKDGLEVEVFLYEETAEQNLLPLKFLPRTSGIKNGILLDEKEKVEASIDPTYVEYYINFNTDYNIPDQDICDGVQNLKANDIELEIPIECPDQESLDFDIYGTRIGPDDIERCD
tara:strand:- start:437 stop:1399 length:963 start_codon:yes stop_codon:yes gene_type:complete